MNTVDDRNELLFRARSCLTASTLVPTVRQRHCQRGTNRVSTRRQRATQVDADSPRQGSGSHQVCRSQKCRHLESGRCNSTLSKQPGQYGSPSEEWQSQVRSPHSRRNTPGGAASSPTVRLSSNGGSRRNAVVSASSWHPHLACEWRSKPDLPASSQKEGEGLKTGLRMPTARDERPPVRLRVLPCWII